MDITEFDDIRPYHDEELARVFDELMDDPAFRRVAAEAFPEIPFEQLEEKMRSIKTKKDFQLAFSCPFMWKIAHSFTHGLTLDHSALEDKAKAYTYISNHRDIVLDSGFLSILLIDSGMDTVEIAIGDNLLIYPWIKKLVRINKSFIVRRALTMRQMLESSARMSRYIHHTITGKEQSIWIAQREGRAKDANDRTQESVLKMLAMGGEGDVIDRLTEVNIVPLTLSYEYDPCDYLKAQEFQLKRDVEGYRKTVQDDLKNMETGLMGYKGRVHLQMAPCLNNELATLDRSLPKTELYKQIATRIDRNIYRNYRMYPCNYIAYDLLESDTAFASHYSKEERQQFERYLQGQLDKIDLPHKDLPYLYGKLLLMYANPLKNQLEAD
jgi:hypothetical protein